MCVSLCLPHCVQLPKKSEEGFGSPGAGDIGSCEPPDSRAGTEFKYSERTANVPTH